MGVIELAQSEWASSVLFGPQADESLRFCIHYRRLNNVKIKDSYPLLRMDEYTDRLADATVFYTLDCNGAIGKSQ